MQKWRVLSSRDVLNSPWLHIQEQSVETDRGNLIPDYYVGSKSDFVMVLAVTTDGQMILLNEYKHGMRDYVWNCPAGGVKPGESPEEAATRELLEETGYVTDELERVGTFAVSSGWLSDKAYLFIGRNAHRVREQRIERGESIQVHLEKAEDVQRMIRENIIQDPYTCVLVLSYLAGTTQTISSSIST